MSTFTEDEWGAFEERIVDKVMDFISTDRCSQQEAIDVLDSLIGALRGWTLVITNELNASAGQAN